MTWVDVTITEVVQETPLDRSFVLTVPAEQRAAFAFAPGQYLRLRDPAEEGERDWYFSLSGAPNAAGTLRITVRGRGAAVRGIYAARPGTIWRVAPPAGGFRIRAPAGEPLVLVAAGSGVTPFRAFVEHGLARGMETAVWLLQSARSASELLFLDELRAWSAAWSAFTYVPTVTGATGGWEGRRGRIDAALLGRALADPAEARVYACGPGAFVDEILATAASLGVPAGHCRREGG